MQVVRHFVKFVTLYVERVYSGVVFGESESCPKYDGLRREVY